MQLRVLGLLWVITLLITACEGGTHKEHSAANNNYAGYIPFENNWENNYKAHYYQYRDCENRKELLQAETDSLVVRGDSFALYVQFILLAGIDPEKGVYEEEPNSEAYPYLVAAGKRGYWEALVSLAVMKDRFGQQKTGASAIRDFYTYGNFFVQYKGQEDTLLMQAMEQHYSWNKELAGKQVVLIPLAFGRYYLQQQYKDLKFSPLYHVKDKEQVYPFVKDPVYKWAEQLAAIDAQQHLFSKEAVLAIMERSPEMKAMQEVIANGESLEGAEFRTLLTL